MKPIYIAADGGPLTDADAERIGPVLNALAAKGHSTTEDIVKAARAKTSPLHPHFKWDNAKAAEAHRLSQAEKLVRHIHIVIEDGDEKRTLRAFHFVHATKEHGHERRQVVPVSVVKANPEYAEQVIAQARAELKSWARRFKDYQAYFGPVLDAIAETLEEAA